MIDTYLVNEENIYFSSIKDLMRFNIIMDYLLEIYKLVIENLVKAVENNVKKEP